MTSEHSRTGNASKKAIDAVIISAIPVVGLGLLHLLEDRMEGLTAYRMDLPELLSTPAHAEPDLLVLAPEGWRDLALWAPQLAGRFAHCPWVLFSDAWVGGLFLGQLLARPCAFVPPTASPALLRAAIRSATSERDAADDSLCLQLFTSLLSARVSESGRPNSTVEEIQCACAISLGLSDREAAALLQQRVVTLRSLVRRLMRLMDAKNREELAEIIQRALEPARISGRCQELYRPRTR